MLSAAAIAIDMTAAPVTRVRDGEGTRVNGVFVPGAPVSTAIRATVLAIDARALQDLPEGIRADARLQAWSRSDLALEDRITWGGDTYRAVFVWPRVEGGFYKAALAKVDQPR